MVRLPGMSSTSLLDKRKSARRIGFSTSARRKDQKKERVTNLRGYGKPSPRADFAAVSRDETIIKTGRERTIRVDTDASSGVNQKSFAGNGFQKVY